MKYMRIGDVIKEFRQRQGISQFELCEGLCEPPTLSKIETGKQNPNKKLLDALVSRLHIPTTLNTTVTKQEFERAQIEREITCKFAKGDFNISELLAHYKLQSNSMSKLERQFYLYADSVIKEKLLSNYESALNGFIEAISITFPTFKLGSGIEKHLFIPLEITILNNIAMCLHSISRTSDAIILMKQLFKCMESTSLEKEEYAKKYPLIAYNLSLWLGLEGRHSESIDIANKGIDCCIKYGRFVAFSRLIYNKGYAYLCLKRTDDGKKLLLRALFSMKILHEQNFFQKAQKDIISSFSEKLWNELEQKLLSTY